MKSLDVPGFFGRGNTSQRADSEFAVTARSKALTCPSKVATSWNCRELESNYLSGWHFRLNGRELRFINGLNAPSAEPLLHFGNASLRNL